MQNKLIPMDLQLFAEDGDGAAEPISTSANDTVTAEVENVDVKPQTVEITETKEEEKGKGKFYTQDEVDEMIKARLARVKPEDNTPTIKDLQAEISGMKEQNLTTNMENYILKKGMSEDDVPKILRVARTYEEEDYKKAIDKAIDEYGFSNKVSISTGTNVKSETQKEEPKTLQDAIAAEMGKKKK